MAHPTRIFHTPDELEQAWQLYKEDLIALAQGWPKVQYVGRDGERVEDYPRLPYTLDGFCVFCYKNYGCANQYFHNKDGLYNDFVTICSHIKQEIRENQITGGLIGAYNPSITQRLNNLVEKTEDVTPPKAKHIKITVKRRGDE